MFDLGPLKVFFGFTQGMQWVYSGCGFALNTEVWSRPIFYLTILPPVISTPFIFQIHMPRLLSGVYTSDWGLL